MQFCELLNCGRLPRDLSQLKKYGNIFLKMFLLHESPRLYISTYSSFNLIFFHYK